MSKIFLLASKFHVQDFEAPDSRAEEVTEENSKIYIGKKDWKNKEIVACDT